MKENKDLTTYNIIDLIKKVEQIKNSTILKCQKVESLIKESQDLMEQIGGYAPLRLDHRQYKYKDNFEKAINRDCWKRIIRLFNLEKYMLCTEYEKLQNDIEENKLPEFESEYVIQWIEGLKTLIYENVKTLVKSVFSRLVNAIYYTGSGYSSCKKKKRNNAGIDKFFIISTSDYYQIIHYSSGATITDDFEKAVYLLAGKTVPEVPAKVWMRNNKVHEYECPYFMLRVCQNGNTHFKILDEEILKRINSIGGGDGANIGEFVKIKVFEERW